MLHVQSFNRFPQMAFRNFENRENTSVADDNLSYQIVDALKSLDLTTDEVP